MQRIVVVSDWSNYEVAAVLQEQLENAFGGAGRFEVVTTPSLSGARAMLLKEVALVITPLHIRRTPTSPLSQNEAVGLELLTWIAKSGLRIPTILIAPTFTEELRQAQPDLGRSFVVYTGRGMIEDIVKRAIEFTQESQSKYLDIEIFLKSKTEWFYKIVGNGFVYETQQQELKIDGPTLDDMFSFSDELGTSDQWQKLLHRIGVFLRHAIEINPLFQLELNEGRMEGGYKDIITRLRFVVGSELHGLALEAVLHPIVREKYWMLEAPVCRRLITGQSAAGGLFKGGGKMRCLIIDAPVSGWVDGAGLLLSKLPHVSEECMWLQETLQNLRDDLNMDPPVVLSARGETQPTIANVRSALEDHSWNLVHYAGHSFYDSDSGTGYIFLPGEIDGSIETVDLKRFSDWLGQSTLTYLSSCDSGTGAFVFELAKRRVPSIVGFRWPIDDLRAFDFSREFYKYLFATKSLERAFLKARQEMHKRYPDSRIWAAPVLIEQIGEA